MAMPKRTKGQQEVPTLKDTYLIVNRDQGSSRIIPPIIQDHYGTFLWAWQAGAQPSNSTELQTGVKGALVKFRLNDPPYRRVERFNTLQVITEA